MCLACGLDWAKIATVDVAYLYIVCAIHLIHSCIHVVLCVSFSQKNHIVNTYIMWHMLHNSNVCTLYIYMYIWPLISIYTHICACVYVCLCIVMFGCLPASVQHHSSILTASLPFQPHSSFLTASSQSLPSIIPASSINMFWYTCAVIINVFLYMCALAIIHGWYVCI